MRGIGNNNIEKTKSEFEIKFDRLYAVQEYIKAFDLCVQNIHTSYKDEVNVSIGQEDCRLFICISASAFMIDIFCCFLSLSNV
mgnify:CR=1 FL=1